ncbi:MAG: helix-turn-helix transcriptional regulator [Steroidobacteraceae bacterium]
MPGRAPRRSLHNGDALSPLSRFILDRLGRAVVLLDAEGAVVDANACAHKVLAGGHGIAARNGRLTFADAQFDGRFLRMLAHPPARTAGLRSIAASLRPADGGDPCRVVVTQAHDHGSERGVRYIVLLYTADGGRGIALDVLAELYGLTRAQADVARSLYEGYSVEETAEQLQLSPNTVRTHLKQIFTKCDVQSQRELLHTLATGPQVL